MEADVLDEEVKRKNSEQRKRQRGCLIDTDTRHAENAVRWRRTSEGGKRGSYEWRGRRSTMTFMMAMKTGGADRHRLASEAVAANKKASKHSRTTSTERGRGEAATW